VAECRLPFSFNVVPKLQGKRKRAQGEQEGDLPPPDARAVRRRIDGPNGTAQIHPLGNGQIHHPVPDIDRQDAHEVVQPREDRISSSPPLAPAPVPPQNASSTSAPLDAIKPPDQPIAPPRTEGESAPTLTEVNPESGSITGGATIWLKGMDFPALFPLFARFGTAVVPTVSSLITFVRHFLIDCPDIQQPLPSCLSPAFRNRPRRCRCYIIEASTDKCAGVWNQPREIPLCSRS